VAAKKLQGQYSNEQIVSATNNRFFAYGCICHGMHLLVHDKVEALPWFQIH